METKFSFKSRPCTSLEQSERLLALGLKKETADLCYQIAYLDCGLVKECSPSLIPHNIIDGDRFIPAWSLDRLKELYKCVGDTSLWNLDDVNYDRLIQCIGLAIKHNSFNKEYLV